MCLVADPTPELTKRLDSLFKKATNPKRASQMRAYMRNQFEYYGIDSPALNEITRQALADLRSPSEAQLKRFALKSWRRPQREWQYFVLGYLRRNVKTATSAFLTTAEELITTKSWWDTVDALASRTVGSLVRADPALRETMDRWIRSHDIWIARTAILHQLFYKEATDTTRLFDYCLQRAGDHEFFIRKAIGWALREYSKTDEVAVRRFVADHGAELSGLSQREALKWLERRASRKKSAGPPKRARTKKPTS